MYLCEILLILASWLLTRTLEVLLQSLYEDPNFDDFNSIEAFTNATLPIT